MIATKQSHCLKRAFHLNDLMLDLGRARDISGRQPNFGAFTDRPVHTDQFGNFNGHLQFDFYGQLRTQQSSFHSQWQWISRSVELCLCRIHVASSLWFTTNHWYHFGTVSLGSSFGGLLITSSFPISFVYHFQLWNSTIARESDSNARSLKGQQKEHLSAVL